MAMQDYVWWVLTYASTWRDEQHKWAQARLSMIPVRSDGTIGAPGVYFTPKVDLLNGFSNDMHGFPYASAADDTGVVYAVGAPSLVINGEFITHYEASARNVSGIDGATVNLKAWSSKLLDGSEADWTPDGAPANDGLSLLVNEWYTAPRPLEGYSTTSISSLIGEGSAGVRLAVTVDVTWHAANLGWMNTYGECVWTQAGLSTLVITPPIGEEFTTRSGFEVEFEDGSTGAFQASAEYVLPV